MSSGLRCGAWLVAAAIVTGAAWITFIPPFESPDESVYLKSVAVYAASDIHQGLPLYDILMKPVAALVRPDPRPFQAEYNPAFRFVSNRRGRVNMFMHGRSEKAAKADLARLPLMRTATFTLWIAALLMIFVTARWWFARTDLALLTAILCLSLPGFSFFSTKVHQEGITAVLGAAAYLIVAARVFGRIGRVSSWVLGLALMALMPFADRQGLFVLLLMPFGLIVAERRWRHAAIAVGVLLIPAALLLLLPQFGHLQTEIWDNLVASFSPAHSGGMLSLENRRYFAFEVFPKLFFGFWGWLGQPSILLPPALYAIFAVMTALGAAGWLLTRDREPLTPEQTRLGGIFAAGLVFTLAPIIYANLFISRNLWHGRWLYPSVGPMMIAMVAGWRASASFARRRPAVAAAVLLTSAAVLEASWLAGPGDFVRAGILGFHYGDRPHFASTISMTIGVLAAAGALAWIAARVPWRIRAGRMPLLLAAMAWAGNLLLLAFFVVPLYRPLDAADFADAVKSEVDEGEPGRASALYRIARATYPGSAALLRLGDEQPALLLGGADDQQLAELQGRIARGESLRSRDEMMALARAGRVKGFLEPEAMRAVIDRRDQVNASTDVAEAIELLRATFDARPGAPAAVDVVRAGGGVPLGTTVQNMIRLEGYTVHHDVGGRFEVTVYFTPLRPWRGRVLWMHAYPQGVDSFISFDAAPPAFDGWKVGELAWDRFILPPGRFNTFVGITEGSVSGNAVPLGWIPR